MPLLLLRYVIPVTCFIYLNLDGVLLLSAFLMNYVSALAIKYLLRSFLLSITVPVAVILFSEVPT